MGSSYLNSAELFNPATSEFELLPHTMSIPREPAGATTLPNGKVLIAGGSGSSAQSAELFNPTTLEFEYLGGEQLVQVRNSPATALLPGDKLLVAGGAYTTTAEIAKPVVQAQMVGGSFGHQPVGEPSDPGASAHDTRRHS